MCIFCNILSYCHDQIITFEDLGVLKNKIMKLIVLTMFQGVFLKFHWKSCITQTASFSLTTDLKEKEHLQVAYIYWCPISSRGHHKISLHTWVFLQVSLWNSIRQQYSGNRNWKKMRSILWWAGYFHRCPDLKCFPNFHS